ncbi:MAG: c-type cytochrome biogenesis protein CcmI, partial [Pseudomonadota bacterium]
MASFWLPLALLSALAMSFVLVPLWLQRGRRSDAELKVREAKNREVFAQRQAELEQEVREGTVAAEDHPRMLSELQRSFMADMQALETLQPVHGYRTTSLRWLPLVLALLIPVAALSIYRSQGAADDLALPALMQAVGTAQDEETQTAALNELAVFLEGRLQRRPEDLQNGYMLGTLYTGIEKYADAARVFELMLTEMEPTPDRATVLGQLAQARYLLAEQVITPDVQAAMDEALALNKNEQAVMSLYAIDSFLKQDFVAALQYWRRQLSDLTPGSQEAETLRERIALIESNLPAEQQAAVQGGTVTVVIDIAPELAAKVTPGMRLYVFVRNPAMPMPILAQNVELPEFPFTIT